MRALNRYFLENGRWVPLITCVFGRRHRSTTSHNNEVNRMWDMKTETIPVVVGALGLIKMGLDKVTSRIPRNISTNEIQKITMLSTAKH